jgi:hypothetical protein
MAGSWSIKIGTLMASKPFEGIDPKWFLSLSNTHLLDFNLSLSLL